MEPKYTVRQAEEMTGVKSYVLRYWEDELDLRIGRNELGHRYYTRYDIQLFRNIRELKKRGLQLRAIKELIPQISRTAPGSSGSKIKLLESEEAVLDKDSVLDKGSVLDKDAVSHEGAVSYKDVVSDIEDSVTDAGTVPFVWVENEKILEFQSILERLITQEMQAKNEDEERYRSLDLAIRQQQMARREAAAAAADKKGRRRGKN